MKIKIAILSKEGFASGFALQIDGQLVLRTRNDLLFVGRDAKNQEFQQFITFVDELVAKGCQVEDWDAMKTKINGN